MKKLFYDMENPNKTFFVEKFSNQSFRVKTGKLDTNRIYKQVTGKSSANYKFDITWKETDYYTSF